MQFCDGPINIRYVIEHVIGDDDVKKPAGKGGSWASKQAKDRFDSAGSRSLALASMPGEKSDKITRQPELKDDWFWAQRWPGPQPTSRILADGGRSSWAKTQACQPWGLVLKRSCKETRWSRFEASLYWHSLRYLGSLKRLFMFFSGAGCLPRGMGKHGGLPLHHLGRPVGGTLANCLHPNRLPAGSTTCQASGLKRVAKRADTGVCPYDGCGRGGADGAKGALIE